MKKTILFGSLLAVFLMLMIPNVSAIEYQKTVDANVAKLGYDLIEFKKTKSQINAIQNIDQNELIDKILLEFLKLDLTKQQRENLEQLIDSDLFSEVLIKGILIPIITILLVESILLTFDLPVFLSSLLGFFLGFFFIGPVALRVSDETVIPYSVIFSLLLLIDVLIPYSILGLIFS